MALTGLTQLQPNNIQVVGIATFDQSVGIAGTLTYQDVTNVDAVGIVTARNGIDCDGDIDVDGHTNLDNVSIAGVVTATTFIGALTGNASGNAGTATALQTARNIGGVSFDGTSDIDLPGVNIAGNQDTSGTAAGLSGSPSINITNCLLYTSPSPRD